jgi:uncharacterized membrane protein YqjE
MNENPPRDAAGEPGAPGVDGAASRTNGAAHGPEPDAASRPAADPERDDTENHPAREVSLHLLRMLETRMEAAGIALQGETQLLMARLQLKLFAGAALFIAIWGGIVLLAIALPEHLRVPVLGAVVAAFVIAAVVAILVARRKASGQTFGSLRWFLDGLRLDLEVLSRALNGHSPGPRAAHDRSRTDDLAA